MILAGGASAHRTPRAVISCFPQFNSGVETGAYCNIENNTKFSMSGTISSPDAGTPAQPLTISPYSSANAGFGFAFVPGATYHFTWTAPHGIKVTAAVQL